MPRRPPDDIIRFRLSMAMPPRLNIDATVAEGCSASDTSPPMARRIGRGPAASDCAAHKASCNTLSSETHLHASRKLYSDKCITAGCEIVTASSRMEGIGGGRNVIFSMVSTRGLGRVVPAVTSEKAAGGGLIYRYVGT